MAPKLNLFATRNALRQITQNSSTSSGNRWGTTRTVVRPTPARQCLGVSPIRRQLYSSDSNSKASNQVGEQQQEQQPKGPTQDTLPSITDEAAAMDKILSGKKCDGNAPGSPELEQGTPIDQILQRDQDALKYAPKVLRDQAKKGTRSYSTSARLQQDLQHATGSPETGDASVGVVQSMIETATHQGLQRTSPGLKFDLPGRLPKTEHFRHRYDQVVEQFTKLMMEDGKLAKAQRNMETVLNHLRTSPPPKLSLQRRLLTDIPAAQLPLNPVLYLNILVDSVAPLIKIRQQKGLTGGGASVPMPVPLSVRQRRRTAISWILAAADKRKDSQFAMRVANELTAVAEGRSGTWEKREQVHKIGVAGRTNLQLTARR